MLIRMNLMNVLKSFHISDHNAIAKAAIEADARHIYWREGSKFWTQEQTTEMLSDYTNNIWKSVEEEVDQALATGDTKDTISRLAELAAYEEDEAEKRRKLHMWTHDFSRYVKTGQRRNALFIAAHLKGALIFYSLTVNKELFVRAMIRSNVIFKENKLGINEEFYHNIKANMKAERLAAQNLAIEPTMHPADLKRQPIKRQAVKQDEMAQYCKVSVGTIKNWERGKHTPPNYPGRGDRTQALMFGNQYKGDRSFSRARTAGRRVERPETGHDMENLSGSYFD